MKRLLLTIVTLMIFTPTVSASSNLNKSYTVDDLELIHYYYYDGYEKHITEEEFEVIKEAGIKNSHQIEFEEQAPISLSGISLNDATSHTTANKSIKLTKTCAGDLCHVYFIVDWMNSPVVRSYDLIGFRYENTYLVENLESRLYVGDKLINFSERKTSQNGTADTFKLSSESGKVKMVKTASFIRSGTVYASYQHAKRAVSLANSRRYTFASNGYGKVMLFENAVRDYYDGMLGLYVSLN